MNKKKTKEEFEKQAKEIHNNIYDYSNVIYVNNSTKVLIKCNKCKFEFNQSPHSHIILKHGCPTCSVNKRRKTIETFIEKAIEIHDEKYDYSSFIYKNNKTKGEILCKKCNKLFQQSPYSHLSGQGCPQCGMENSIKKRTKSIENFIKDAQKKHGKDKYDYSVFRYINNKTHGIIICQACKMPFKQTPHDHLDGCGCPQCGRENSTRKRTKLFEEFIKQAEKIHGNIYDYSEAIYKNNKTKVRIKCNNCSHIFSQSPDSHINQKQGCPNCCGNFKNTESFIKQAIEIHGEGKFDYSLTNYVNAKVKVIVICLLHGLQHVIPNVHLRGKGCPECNPNFITTKIFINRSNEIHNNKYVYEQIIYRGCSKKVKIKCLHHGYFWQKPTYHLAGHGCPKCGYENTSNLRRKSLEEFIKQAVKIHGEKYDYTCFEYKNTNTPGKIICNKCMRSFNQMPNSHLAGQGCKYCSKSKQYSKSQIEWLKIRKIVDNVYIQHVENEGEYKIPGTNYRVDGYSAETNIVYQFHGDFYHGNPKRFDINVINPKLKKTYGELYQKTLDTNNIILQKGFKLVEIWEWEWVILKKIKKQILKSIQKINV